MTQRATALPTRLLSVCIAMITAWLSAWAAAQDLAPASIPANSALLMTATVTDHSDGSVINSTFNLFTTSATAFNDGDGSFGTYTYTKLTPNTGRVNYVSNYSEPGYTYRETGVLQLTFTSKSAGTVAISGNYSGTYEGQGFSGSLSGSGTFGLDTPPTITNVANVSTPEDTPLAIPFTVGDPVTPENALVVTASSSNLTLLPSSGVLLEGTGASRSMSLTPATDKSGTATVTLTVSDGTYTATDTFVLTVTAVNDTPAISDIPDQVTNEDTATALIPFAVFDVETASPTVTCTSSSNTTLIPLANVTLAGSGTGRTVKVTPAANQSGTSLLTIRSSDGTNFSTDTFLVTVLAVNDAPTISDVTNKSVAEDVTTPAIAFTIGDIDTPATSLVMSGGSSNTNLVPVENIVFAGTGASRTVTLSPAANQSGSTTITLTVSDGELSTTDTFVLTVTAVNDAPTISGLPNLTTSKGTSTGALAFTIGDPETAATSLTVTRATSNTTLVPLANIVLGGSGASRTVTITPAANQTGTATITVNVSDGLITTPKAFVLTVIDAQTVASWRQTHFGTSANDGDAADLHDFDKDGLPNLLEFALGGHPKDSSNAIRPVISREMSGGTPYLTLTITKPSNITGVTYTVQVAGDLSTWASGDSDTTVITNSATTLTVRDNTPAISGTRFIRLAVAGQ